MNVEILTIGSRRDVQPYVARSVSAKAGSSNDQAGTPEEAVRA